MSLYHSDLYSLKISSVSFSSFSVSYLQQVYTPQFLLWLHFFNFFIFSVSGISSSPTVYFSALCRWFSSHSFSDLSADNYSFSLTLDPYFWLAAGCDSIQYLSSSLCTNLELIVLSKCTFSLFLLFNTTVSPLITQEKNTGIISYSSLSFSMTLSWLSSSLHASLIYLLHHSISMPISLVKVVSCLNSWRT